MSEDDPAAVLAIDAGNSKTDVAVVSADGAVCGTARGGPFRPDRVGAAAAVAGMAPLVDKARSDAGLDGPGPFARHVSACLANADLPIEHEALESAIATHRWGHSIEVFNDTFALLRAGLDEPRGVAVVCGAGINCAGLLPDGRTARFAAVGHISGDWGGRPLEDLKAGWSAALAKYRFLDGDRACALGASYGGYMVYWMAGVWNGPWKCFVDHDGVFDARMMYYATEELWFEEKENGGTPFEHPENYERFNPVNHVKDWRVPMLVVHSGHDFRIPITQGLGAFTALQRRGIPSEFLTFPDENHFVLKPQNSVQWHETVNAWLKKWTAVGADTP